MFSFLKKPIINYQNEHDSSNTDHHDHNINVQNTHELAGEDVGQIAVDILETVE